MDMLNLAFLVFALFALSADKQWTFSTDRRGLMTPADVYFAFTIVRSTDHFCTGASCETVLHLSMHSSDRNRKRQSDIWCGHCNENVSLEAATEHVVLYWLAAETRWRDAD